LQNTVIYIVITHYFAIIKWYRNEALILGNNRAKMYTDPSQPFITLKRNSNDFRPLRMITGAVRGSDSEALIVGCHGNDNCWEFLIFYIYKRQKPIFVGR